MPHCAGSAVSVCLGLEFLQGPVDFFWRRELWTDLLSFLENLTPSAPNTEHEQWQLAQTGLMTTSPVSDAS